MEKTAENWTEIAKNMHYVSRASSTKIYKRREENLLRKYASPLEGKKILKLDLWNEVNNTGILYWLAQNGCEVHGIDLSPFLVEKTKEHFLKKNLNGTFHISDIRSICYPDNSFDFIYTMGTIEHIPDYEKAIKEIHRVLKQGGTAIIGVPNKHDPFLRPALVRFLEKIHAYPYSPEKSFSKKELRRDIEKQGLKVTAQTSILFMPGLLRMLDIFFAQHLPLLSKTLLPIFLLFEYIEHHTKSGEQNGYLIACVAKK